MWCRPFQPEQDDDDDTAETGGGTDTCNMEGVNGHQNCRNKTVAAAYQTLQT